MVCFFFDSSRLILGSVSLLVRASFRLLVSDFLRSVLSLASTLLFDTTRLGGLLSSCSAESASLRFFLSIFVLQILLAPLVSCLFQSPLLLFFLHGISLLDQKVVLFFPFTLALSPDSC